jgi:hypothetical protein
MSARRCFLVGQRPAQTADIFVVRIALEIRTFSSPILFPSPALPAYPIPISLACNVYVEVCANDLPRPKKKRFPDGYPGDPYSTSFLPLKYFCHRCSEVFSAIPHPSSPEGIALAASDPAPLAPECAQCGHRKCHECPRAPIVQIEPAPDPEIMRRVEAELAALNIGAEEGTAL